MSTRRAIEVIIDVSRSRAQLAAISGKPQGHADDLGVGVPLSVDGTIVGAVCVVAE